MTFDAAKAFEDALDKATMKKWRLPGQRGPHHCGQPMEHITLPSGRRMLACKVCRKRRFT